MTTSEELLGALGRLRDAARGVRRDRTRELADWRVVDAFVRRNRAAMGEDGDDIAQDALIAIARHVGTLDAEDPGAVVAWVTRIVRHKKIDRIRRRAIERKQLEPSTGETSAVDLLERDDGGPIDEQALGRLVEAVEEGLIAYVATLRLAPAEAHLRRLQARATLHRVLGESVPELRAILALDESVTTERLWKWIERGRPTLDATLERLIAAHEGDAAAVFEALREALHVRRADAGIARPSRRKSPEEEAPR